MLSIATIKAFEIYGISIAISMSVAVLIKVLVAVTGRVKPAATAPAPVAVQPTGKPAAAGITGEVLAAISAAITIAAGPHRILHIAESKRSWSSEGRIAQHSHQPRH